MNLFKKLLIIITVIRVAIIDIGFWLLVILLVALFSNSDTVYSSGETLLIQPGGNIVESLSDPSLLALVNSGDDGIPEDILLRDIIDSIDFAIDDNNIDSIVLDTDYLGYVGLASIEEIGKSLQKFKATGKKVYAYSSFYPQSHYYLSSFSDEIVMDPYGEVSLDGLGIYRNYWKDTLDKYDVDVRVFRAGEYKSYVEPYISTSMSKAVKQQNLLWMGKIWDNILSVLSKNRSFNEGTLINFTQNKLSLLTKYKGDSAKLAVEEGFVDSLKTRDEFYESFVDLYDFRNYLAEKRSFVDNGNIAVITLEGAISYSNNNSGYISALEIIDLIDRALEDGVSGLVIRINSGGGGAYASEVIRRKLEDVKKHIPVVISMGDVCASGGYWIASAGDYILADNNTITGSIGVFGLSFGLENTLKNNLGVHNDGVGTTPYAAAGGYSKNLSDEVAGIYQLGVDDIYRKFLKIVSDSREIPLEGVKDIAGGRVWSGSQAMDKKLIDQIGGYNEVKEFYKEYLESSDISFVFYDREEPFLGQIMQTVFNNASISSSLKPFLNVNEVTKELSIFEEIDDPKKTYALWY